MSSFTVYLLPAIAILFCSLLPRKLEKYTWITEKRTVKTKHKSKSSETRDTIKLAKREKKEKDDCNLNLWLHI